MDKQELIKKIKDISLGAGDHGDTKNEHESEYALIAYILDLVNRLDEPQKVKVPVFVAEWFEEHKDDLEFSIWKLTIESNDNYTSDRSKMRNWIQHAPNKPYETLLSMKNGYEVEEEPKWVVKVGNLYFCGWEDTTAQFVMNTMLGEEDAIIKYKRENTALAVAKNLGGTVEKV